MKQTIVDCFSVPTTTTTWAHATCKSTFLFHNYTVICSLDIIAEVAQSFLQMDSFRVDPEHNFTSTIRAANAISWKINVRCNQVRVRGKKTVHGETKVVVYFSR